MSPLWGFGVFGVCRVCYKHAAPLGLKAPTAPKSGHGLIVGARFYLARWVGEPTNAPKFGAAIHRTRVGEPNPYGFNGAVASCFLIGVFG